MKSASWLGLSIILLFSSPSWGYLSIGESGEIHPVGQYLIGVQPQILMNEGGGATIGTFLDMPWREDASSRFSLGVGKIDFHLGASIKYIPFPDVDRQPAMGIKVSAWYARHKDLNVTTFQIAPLFSKKYDTDIGVVIPYAAVPVNFFSSSEDSGTGTQFTIGSELRHNEVENMYFSAEVVLNLKDSYSFIAGTLTFPFDSERGFQLRGR